VGDHKTLGGRRGGRRREREKENRRGATRLFTSERTEKLVQSIWGNEGTNRLRGDLLGPEKKQRVLT